MSGLKRGYIACFTNLPPLLYYFQYNPGEISITKTVTYDSKGIQPSSDNPNSLDRGYQVQQAPGMISSLMSSAGGFFSTAEQKRFAREGDRVLTFRLFIDGAESGPREPKSFRQGGDKPAHILEDLAILESFVYPAPGNILDVLGQAASSLGLSKGKSPGWANIWFAQPPVATVTLGDIAVEGFVTDLRTKVTQWNSDLEPTRAEVDMTVLEKPNSLTSLINHGKRLFYSTKGSIRQIGTNFEED